MSKIKIEDLPRLEDLDPEDQRLIRGGTGPTAQRPPRHIIRPAPSRQPPDDDIIVSRIPPES